MENRVYLKGDAVQGVRSPGGVRKNLSGGLTISDGTVSIPDRFLAPYTEGRTLRAGGD
jgi:hypothetical protein